MEECKIMNDLDNSTMLSAAQICGILDITPQTLYSWYRWYNGEEFTKPKNLPELPRYYQRMPRAKRFWKANDVDKLKIFQKFVGKGRGGIMGEYNARKWQERGKRALENKRIQKG